MTELIPLGAGVAASIAAGGFALDRWVARSIAGAFVVGALAGVGSGAVMLAVLHLHLAAPVAASHVCVWGHQ
jgi:hypothetical protein